jgi:penicillin-binding protein 2
MMMEKASSRLRILALLVALMFVALSARLWFLQVLAAPKYAQEAADNGHRPIYEEALRGLIRDRTGIVLVGNRPSLEVLVTPDQLGDEAEAVIARLAELLDVPVSDITAALGDDRYYDYQTRPVSEFTDERVTAYIAEHPELFPGVTWRNTSVRDYPLDRTAAHLLGSVGIISAQDYKALKDKGYGQNDTIGRAGLEKTYEKFLRGKKGQTVYLVNSDQEVIRTLREVDSVPGDDVHLTIDAGWQQIAEEELLAGMQRARELDDSAGDPLRANAGAVVILDAKTGAVRAMASLPSYDPRWFVTGLTKQQSKYFANDAAAPLVDRAYQLAYAPGSTFKPITSLVAVHQGVASFNNYYPCTTEYVHGTDVEHPFVNWEPYNAPPITFAEALRISCDTFFEQFGSEFFYHYVNDQFGEDAQPLQRELRDTWRFGEPTGVDAPGEVSGTIPDAAYASEHPELYEAGRWQPFGDILLMIGAGNVGVSPLQLATAYGAIANGGALCRPFLVDRITDSNDELVRDPGPRCNRKLPYTPLQLSYIRQALAGVVSGGTAACAFSGFPLSQVPVGGKTGTAERGTPRFQDTSWFASIVGPTDDPDYVVVTMVEQGGFGGQTAAPITRNIIERIEGLGETPRTGCGQED